MKKENLRSMLAWTKYFFSSMILGSVIFLCGCDIGGFDLDWGSGWGSGIGCCNYGSFDFGPATPYADSVTLSHDDDSLTLHGHYSSWQLNSRIEIIEYGIFVYKNFQFAKSITLGKDTAWTFADISSTVSVKAKILTISQNIDVHFTVYYIAKNSQGVNTTYESPMLFIQQFEPAFVAVQDSVTFPENYLAVLWGHLETKSNCEIMSVKIIWNDLYEPTKSDSIPVKQYMKANEIIIVRDTIKVNINHVYQWRIEALAKFTNDSLAWSPYNSSQFMR